MPHIVAKSYYEFDTPAKAGEFDFLWFAKPYKNAKDTLVGVQWGDERFLLEIKPKDEHYVIKADKITRPAPTFIVKQALRAFCELAKCEVLHDNLSTIKPSHAAKAHEYLKDIEFFLHSFPKDKEVWIEVGFGSARHLLYQAKEHPEILFIGIEIHKPSIEQALKQIALQKLQNIFILDYDARLFLEFVPSNVVGKIFVHFPVPWDKKPHRRVISKPFIQEAKRVLKPGGILELRTDSRLYFDYSLDLFLQESKADLEVTKNIEPPIVSKYEARWLRLGKDIYDIRYINHEHSPNISFEADFSFKNLRYGDKILKNFDNKPKVYEDFFIHFEKLYKIEPNRMLLELSFGSFDRPEHKYILIEEEGAEYFPKAPIASRANIKAHKKIEELFNE